VRTSNKFHPLASSSLVSGYLNGTREIGLTFKKLNRSSYQPEISQYFWRIVFTPMEKDIPRTIQPFNLKFSVFALSNELSILRLGFLH